MGLFWGLGWRIAAARDAVSWQITTIRGPDNLHVKLMFASHLLAFCWPKQVCGPAQHQQVGRHISFTMGGERGWIFIEQSPALWPRPSRKVDVSFGAWLWVKNISFPGPGVLRLISLILETLRIWGQEPLSKSVWKDPVRTASQHPVKVLSECPACVCGMAQTCT